jgi:hypothetical protein
MSKEVDVAYFNILSHVYPERTENIHEKPQGRDVVRYRGHHARKAYLQNR